MDLTTRHVLTIPTEDLGSVFVPQILSLSGPERSKRRKAFTAIAQFILRSSLVSPIKGYKTLIDSLSVGALASGKEVLVVVLRYEDVEPRRAG